MIRASLLGLAVSAAAGCAHSPIEEKTVSWNQETAYEGSTKLGGCTVGDLDPDRPGQEIAVVAGNGDVILVFLDQGEWQSETVDHLPGEMIQCAAGNLLPDHPGDELITVGIAQGGEDDGGPGSAWVFFKTSSGWQRQKAFEDSALLHAVCMGPPGTAFVAGYSHKVHRLERGPDGWAAGWSADLAGPAKGAAWSQDGLAICDANGRLNIFDEGGQAIPHRAAFPAPQARIARDGARVLVCDNGGDLRLLNSPTSIPEVIHHESDRLRGAVFADLLAESPGLECATAGYRGDVTLVYRHSKGEWHAEPVGHDSDRFHHLATGVLPGRGISLVGCGYSGRVTVVSRRR